jgi:protein involved in polysaccharide export with SLBB domain
MVTPMHLGKLLITIGCGCLLWGCSTDVADDLPPAPTISVIAPAYLVQPGDQLDVKFYFNPELNEQPYVMPDGKAAMQFAVVDAGGKTLDQIRGELTDEYSKQLLPNKLALAVALKTPAQWHIAVVGEVTHPGNFTDTGPPLTLAQAIAHAGGVTDNADANKVVLLRRYNGEDKAYLMNFRKATNGEIPQADVQLTSNDVVFVPKSGIANIYKGYNLYFKQFIPQTLGIGFSP